jgi:Flp pilus assembly protein TadG
MASAPSANAPALPPGRLLARILGFIRVGGRRRLAGPADKRGATSLIFAVSASVFFAFVALATEAGSWYLVRRNAQNAVDAAARAGAIALALTSSAANRQAQITAAGTDLAGRNGFTGDAATTIDLRHPPTSGPRTGNQAAVEAAISQVQPLYLASLFLAEPPTVSTRAVAVLEGTANACILALNGGLSMGGNSFTSGQNCVLASNASASDSVSITGSADVYAYTLHSVGGCSGCDVSRVHLTRPYSEYQLPVSNPYAALDDKVFPASCLATPPSSGEIQPTGLTNAYCSSVSPSNHQTLNFAPGTYVFRNASVQFGSGTTVTCSACTGGAGVTIIFTGDPALIGGIKINAQASVTLQAPRTNPDDPDLNGVLFFRDPRATSNSTSNPAVQINGGADTKLSGAMYFPQSYVKFNGNASATGSTCTALIAGTLDFNGTADTYVDVSSCATYGAAVPQVQVVRLVE